MGTENPRRESIQIDEITVPRKNQETFAPF
jgi:hypothetical protein